MISLLLLWPLSISAFADISYEGHRFVNILEGNSHYINSLEKNTVENHIENNREVYESFFDINIFGNPLQYCEWVIAEKIFAHLSRYNKVEEGTLFIKGLRHLNYIDDTVLRLIIPMYQSVLNARAKTLPNIPVWKLSKKDELLFKNFKENKGCLNVTAKSIIYSLNSQNPNRLESLVEAAYRKNYLSLSELSLFRDLITSKDYLEGLNLDSYGQTLSFLDRIYPQRRIDPVKSDFAAKLTNDGILSRRENFYRKFDKFEIGQLRNVVERLIKRVGAARLKITAYDYDDNVVEEIDLIDPLEVYRYSGKMISREINYLRKEKDSKLIQKDVTFYDVLIASLETGLVKAPEIESLSEMESLWTKKVGKYQKYFEFVERYGVLSLAALPPGYEVVRILAIVAIEMTGEIYFSEETSQQDFYLF